MIKNNEECEKWKRNQKNIGSKYGANFNQQIKEKDAQRDGKSINN